MYLERSETLNKAGESASAFLRRYDITRTPQNYEISFEYCLGRNADLRRVVDIMLSNRHVFDDEALGKLHRRYLSSEREEQALRDASSRIQDNLQELSILAASGAGDALRFELAIEQSCKELNGGAAPLATLLARLLQDAQEMASRSQRLGRKLKQSGEKIDVLEKTLSEAQRDATIDGLTGVFNRKAFDMSLRELAGHAMNSGNELSLLLLDVDHFKRVNDMWGHQKGDEVLCLVAETVREHARIQDRPARYGGEEFAVILPDNAGRCRQDRGRHSALARADLLRRPDGARDRRARDGLIGWSLLRARGTACGMVTAHRSSALSR